MKRIRRGDSVIVITGKSKGHVGQVAKVHGDKIIVEGANLVKKHVKPNPSSDVKGGILSVEAAIHVSNVALYNPVTKKADRVGFKFVEESENKSKKVRYFKSNNELVDLT